MSAQLLYKMIKSKTEYPLHKAIKVEREDVVFLYLIEMDSQVSSPQTTLIKRSLISVCSAVISRMG